MTDPIDLDELERQLRWLEGSPPGDSRQASLRRVEKQKRLLRENRAALLAAARRLREVESQLAHIHASGHCGADIMTPERIEAWARELGWKGTP